MAPSANVEIPVFIRSIYRQPPTGYGVAPLKLHYDMGGRQDEPLSAMPSNLSPRNAKIIGRVMGLNGAFYQIKVGNVEIDNVSVDEILDYVSAQQLEDYENGQFEEEAEMIRVAEAYEEEERANRLQRRKERAKLKRIEVFQELDRTDESAGTSGCEVAIGKHGRARPSYTHLYKGFNGQRTRKRNLPTGDSMPLIDDECVLSSSEDIPSAPIRRPDSYSTLPETLHRSINNDMSRKEHITLSVATQSFDEEEKRQRRRKYPVTGVLMPIGRSYNPDVPQASQDSSGKIAMLGRMSTIPKRLSLSQGHVAKRIKTGHSSLSARSLSPAIDEGAVIASFSSENDNNEAFVASAPILSPSPTDMRVVSSVKPHLQAKESFYDPETSPERNTMTSILDPFTAPVTSREQSADNVGDDEWFLECILTHKLSDPRTHPPELGKKPVTLYCVKWEGFDDPTWEPIESFPDRSVVDDYYCRIAAKSKGKHTLFAKKERRTHSDEATETASATALPSIENEKLIITINQDKSDLSEMEVSNTDDSH